MLNTREETPCNSDMVEFRRIENNTGEGAEFKIGATFPREAEYHLRHIVKYRIKLLLKPDTDSL